ncbi:uncharacterized protein LOC113279040 [Papaver somniferum]|uniref:uncharacterized protein LOC113279040 n=1 Tax=Papaver somniferum TaxID=3469 RepID=UPI000E706019|nr:uncharacterized protein LOC113279040 [Papaver somniferum]
MLQRQITTTVSIPPHCRLHFSRTLKSSLDFVIANPTNLVVWLRLLLLPICTLNLYEPKRSSEERSGNRRKLQAAAINSALLTWKEPSGCYILVQQLLDLTKQPPKQRVASKKKSSKNLVACRKKLSYSHYTAAIRILSSSGVAPPTPDTLYELQQKHPLAQPPVIPTEAISAPAISMGASDVLLALKSFPKGTSCGRDGLRAQHLLDAMSGASAAIADDLLQSITGVVNLWLAGKCPSILGEFVASAPLTPLLKPGGGLRPIVVGTIWRRLCSKLAANSVCKSLNPYLGNFQYGVGIPCGGVGILHSSNRLIVLCGSDTSKTMMLIDFTNAFNIVDRSTIIREVRALCPSIAYWVEFCYMKPARLYYRDHILSSTQGVQQGDPLGPLLFALALHTLIEKIASNCTLDFNSWYLDDGTIAGDTLEVYKAFKILQDVGPSYGLHLNIAKTELFWPSFDPRRESAFPVNIGKATDGVKLLGGPVSLDPSFCCRTVAHRVDKTIQLMDKIQVLCDPQCELLLLRSCTGLSRLFFALRTTFPMALLPDAERFDSYLMQYLRRLVVGDNAGFGKVQQRLATLPIK